MSGIAVTKFLAGFYSFFIFCLFLSVADQHLGRRGMLPLPATTLAVLTLLPLVGGVLLHAVLSMKTRRVLVWSLKQNAPAILAFGLVAFASLLFALHPTAYWKDDAKWIFLIVYAFIIFLFASIAALLSPIQKAFDWIVLAAIFLLGWSMAYELNHPGFFSTVVSRAAGFPGNSNFGALVMVLLCSAALRYQGSRSRLFDAVVLGVGGFGVAITQSRSGLMNFVLLLVLYCKSSLFSGRSVGREASRLLISVVVLACSFVVIFPMVTSGAAMFSMYNTRFANLLSSKQIDDGSSESRLAAAADAIRRINASPIIGHGTGHTRTMDELPHNIYLNQWVNNGLLGLTTYIGLLATSYYLFWRRNFQKGKSFICCTALGGLFSHNILDQRPFLLLLGTLITLSLVSRTRQISSGDQTLFAGSEQLPHA